jgi:indole-3-glycerol phosphate synthase
MIELVLSAQRAVERGYYSAEGEERSERRSLVDAIKSSEGIAVIAEVKFSSPSEGRLKKKGGVGQLAKAYQRGGAVAISVLTAPEHFDGSLRYVSEVKESVKLPVLMKDVVIGTTQIDAARRKGADAILLIANVFLNRLVDLQVEDLIDYSHSRGLEVLLEAHTEEEYEFALESSADILGINNRNLGTLATSWETSKALLSRFKHRKPVICESGITSRDQVLALKRLGADGFLIGSALMKSTDPVMLLRELIGG